MNKKIKMFFMPLLALIFLIVLVACSTTEDPNRFFIAHWKVNGLIVETDIDLLTGDKPEFNKGVPVKEADDEYMYTFIGWSTKEDSETGVPASELPGVSSHITYYAIFKKEVIVKYTITWEDADGTLLATTEVVSGVTPNKELPSDTAEWDYTSWEPSVSPAEENITYKAQRNKQVYTVTFVDVLGSVISQKEYEYGALVVLENLPIHEDTVEWDYSQSSWDKEALVVTGDVTYNEVLNREKQVYTITWNDHDGTLLGTTNVLYGTKPSYKFPEESEEWDYIGWSPKVQNVTANQTYTALIGEKTYFIENEVLVDNQDVSITVVEVNDDPTLGFSLNIEYSNKKDDLTLVYLLESVVVNGYMMVTSWEGMLEPLTSSSANIYISPTYLQQAGITSIDKLELIIQVYDADDWFSEDILYGVYTLYPTGLSEEDIVVPNRPIGDNEFVLVDSEILEMTVLETYMDNEWGYSLITYIENKTTDKELIFNLGEVSVNGYRISSLWSAVLIPGARAVTTIQLSISDLELAGITTIDKIELSMVVYDYIDWESDDIVNEVFKIYPTGLTDDQIVSPDRPTSENEFIVFENEDVAFIIIESYMDPIWGYTVKAYIENKTEDLQLIISWSDELVNNVSLPSNWYTSINAGSKGIIAINFYESDLTDNGITNVESISFLLSVYDANDWYSDYIIDQTYEYIIK